MNSAGIGLGLTIVKEIVEHSGGTITAESEGSNKGSVFTFTMIMNPVEVSAFNFPNIEAAPNDSESHRSSQPSQLSNAASQ